MTQGRDGTFYGTTQNGGVSNNGTVYKIGADGLLVTLVEFTGNGPTNRGSAPFAGVLQGSDGDFYGTTYGGGTSNLGTVFKMTPSGALTTLVDFTGNGASQKGARPTCALIEGNNGNFYGTTELGGGADVGTIFRVTPGGVLSTLAEFSGGMYNIAGKSPSSPLVQDAAGNLYGTTQHGGPKDTGTLFCLTPQGAFQRWPTSSGGMGLGKPRAILLVNLFWRVTAISTAPQSTAVPPVRAPSFVQLPTAC